MYGFSTAVRSIKNGVIILVQNPMPAVQGNLSPEPPMPAVQGNLSPEANASCARQS